jgi:hypothetical protein
MTRLISEHFKKDGTPKKSFETKREALESRPLLDRENWKAYVCGFCGKRHLAKTKRQKKRPPQK